MQSINRADMLATNNSPAAEARPGQPPPARLGCTQAAAHLGLNLLSLAIVAGVWFNLAATAGEGVLGERPGETNSAARAQRLFLEARSRHEAEPGRTEFAWQFARACFDRAEFATNKTERAAIAEQGIAACRLAVVREPKSAPAHYYLAMDLGQLAQTRTLGALKIVPEMEREFAAARQLDEQFDYAGPDRNLGLLYSEAPGWPTSIGSRSKARQHLQRAAALAPDYPENRLNLIEALLKWSDRPAAQREMKSLEDSWPRARTNFTGEAWTTSWADWNARLKQARTKTGELAKPLESPRTKN
jgi:hypothetical protein